MTLGNASFFSPSGMYVVDKAQCRGDDPIEKAKIT
jgi:hypothetical protein